MASDSVSMVSAFLAGFVSFISPCVLPLVPVYLTSMTGLSAEELSNRESRPITHILRSAVLFCLGLSLVFIALGLTATTVGGFLTDHLRTFEVVAGILIVVLGFHMTGLFKIKFLYRTFQFGSQGAPQGRARAQQRGLTALAKPFLMGAAFAFGWTPCIGPILAAVLAIAATQETVGEGGLLLAIYSLGLSLPFILSGLAFGSFTTRYQRFRRHLHRVEIVAGILLMFFGVLIATHNLTLLVSWLSQMIPQPNL